ncbi:hypothetical protein QQN17_000653 [Escherichia coli]|nr:hypothetical protein [Escherichia coli]ELM8655559.1 hypothetical protein [Escherichia coli]ELM8765147.1 hypothetical protein [Escherichia coli]ELR4874488.1 hypothetical protein [Escherichia coli]
MGKKNTRRICLGRPRVIDSSTLAIGLYSMETGIIGQVLISVNVVAIYGGAVEVPPEIMEKLKGALSPERITSFKLGNAD